MRIKKINLMICSILCFAFINIGGLEIVNGNSIDNISFSSGVTIFSPLNTTYNSRILNLNMTFDQGAGIICSLNYTLDGNKGGSIPLVIEDTGFHTKFQKSGLVTLPELSDGPHYLTIDVLCGIYDYNGTEPPGAPFKPTFSGSSDYVATWTHKIHFTIESPVVEPDMNWVEVTTLKGNGDFESTDPFIVDHADWRIKWELESGDGATETAFQAYIFPLTGNEGSENWIEKIEQFGKEETTGILNIFNHSGSFYMEVHTDNVNNYTMTIEQNVNSIPEFPSAVFLPISLVSIVLVLLTKKRLKNQHLVKL